MNESYKTRQTLLMRAKNADDNHAWEEFVSYYSGFIGEVLSYMQIPESSRDDIRQEILVTIWKALPSFEVDAGRARFRTWFSRLIRNKILQCLAKTKRTSDTQDKISTSGQALWETTSENEFEARLEQEWQVYLGNLAMNEVKKVFTGNAIEVFMMDLDGKSTEEISAALNLTKSSVYKLKGRVRDRLLDEVTRLRHELEL